MLTLLMYLGRGDFGPEDLLGTYAQVSDGFSKPESAVNQMMSKAPLALYLSDGLRHLSEAGIDVDELLGSGTAS